MLPNPGAMHTPIHIRNRPIRYARTILVQHTAIGMLAGWLVLHPVTMAIYWFEFNGHTGFSTHILLEILERVFLSFSPLMLSMAGLFVLFGGAMGLGHPGGTTGRSGARTNNWPCRNKASSKVSARSSKPGKTLVLSSSRRCAGTTSRENSTRRLSMS